MHTSPLQLFGGEKHKCHVLHIKAFTDIKQLFVTCKSLQFSHLFPKEFSAGEAVCVWYEYWAGESQGKM